MVDGYVCNLSEPFPRFLSGSLTMLDQGFQVTFARLRKLEKEIVAKSRTKFILSISCNPATMWESNSSSASHFQGLSSPTLWSALRLWPSSSLRIPSKTSETIPQSLTPDSFGRRETSLYCYEIFPFRLQCTCACRQLLELHHLEELSVRRMRIEAISRSRFVQILSRIWNLRVD
jgi:hypothetical protein